MISRHTTYLLLFQLLFLIQGVYSQTYGNEWINYNQKYYQFKIINTGIHRISYDILSSAGVPLSSFQSANIQIFGREREVPIHIVDGGDNSIDPGDYLIFYAERNDGWLDSTLYQDPAGIGNPAYSLYNDTINYFFTWNSSTSNLRYTVESDINFAAYPTASAYILSKVIGNYNSHYIEGERESIASSSFFTNGEGWMSAQNNGVPNSVQVDLSLSTPYPYTGFGSDAVFHGLTTSSSNASYTDSGNHHLRWEIGSSYTPIHDTIYTGYKQIRSTKSFSTSLLTNGNTPVRWRIIDDQGADTDFQSFSYYSIAYTRLPNFGGTNAQNFKVKNDPQGKIKLDISNLAYNIPIMLVHGDVPRMVPLVPNTGVYSVLIPNSSNGVDQEVIFRDTTLISNILSITPVNGSGNFTDFTTGSLYTAGTSDEALIFIYHPKLEAATDAYRDYRSSLSGGSYNVLKANIDELYLQFGGGIEKHANGIRRFAHYLYNQSTIKPVGLFLVGKGIREASTNITGWDGAGTRKNVALFHLSLIPSLGQPSSDICLTAGLEGSYNWVPLIPTGRISAQSNEELSAYLDKVILHENQQDQTSVYHSNTKDWQKHIMHFAGGSDASQQSQFQGYLNYYETIIEDSLIGGNVTEVFKTSSNPIDPTILAGITDRIEEGVSLMTYFGHASPSNSGFEINLDEPQNWNNYGKYPLMLVNSCYNGNIFQGTTSKSEEFVQIPQFGAIGYIASVGNGLDLFLNQYSIRLYREMSFLSYGQTIGEQMRRTVQVLEPAGGLYTEVTATQMALNGDPMIRLNWHQKPEIELLEENVSFLPNNINLSVDSLEISILIKNLGRSVVDTFTVEVIRNFPGSSVDSVYLFVVPKLHYTHQLTFKMPLQANISGGLNYFTIKADIPSQISEQYDEVTNNQIIRQFHLNLSGIIPVIPYDYAVVPIDSVTVKASTINPIAPFQTYRFEIDTTDLYNSPQHRYALVSGLGGVKEVHPSQWLSVASGSPMPLTCTDSSVYFWRVAVDSSVLEWREHSFQYITGKEGWGQDHFFQFKNNSFNNLAYDRPTRTRNFAPTLKEVTCDVLSSTTGLDPYFNAYYIDGELMSYGIWTNFTPKLHVAVIDPMTSTPWKTGQYNFGANNNAEPNWKYFAFHQDDPAKLANFQNMVLNGVPDGHYILIYSPMTTRYDWWNSLDSANMYNTFDALGSDSIHGGRPNRPFAFFCKKGDTTSVVEEFVQIAGGEAHLTADMLGSDYAGSEVSTLIGPASSWGSMFWKQEPMEAPYNDTTILHIKAFDQSGVLQLEIDTAFTLNDSILGLQSLVDASLYPYLQLQASYKDSIFFTPAQVDYWHVLYQPLPEAAIDGTTAYSWIATTDTLNEGQTFQFAVDIKNIFNIDMDSLLVKYWIEDPFQVKHPITYARQDSLRVTDVLRDTITVSTTGLGGWNSLWMEVNPYLNGSLYLTDQPEQKHFNNLLQIPFYVRPDDRNPILDVTFNGQHILNGDIIDPNSEILITLKDDNEFLIMNEVADTALFGIYLTDPAGVLHKIPFMNGSGETVMQWIPADSQHKRFKIIWPAEFTMDGKYTLTVQGSDKSGNLSGDIEYRVSFEVIHESSITHMMNYPNPFSTSTRFVFTLTGSEVPDDIIIQIMTVSGRVVREITEDQLGTIRIGRNITEYAWDGRDEFGDPLANGVYLYQVKAKINGEDIEHRESGADQYFKKNFGKMYLMR